MALAPACFCLPAWCSSKVAGALDYFALAALFALRSLSSLLSHCSVTFVWMAWALSMLGLVLREIEGAVGSLAQALLSGWTFGSKAAHVGFDERKSGRVLDRCGSILSPALSLVYGPLLL